MLVLVITYAAAMALVPTLSTRASLVLHFIHALTWVFIHYVGLGQLLRAQSENKFMVRHFLKNYHYPEKDVGQGPIIEAFTNWKAIYNMSMCMTYGPYPVMHSAKWSCAQSPLPISLVPWSRVEVILLAQ